MKAFAMVNGKKEEVGAIYLDTSDVGVYRYGKDGFLSFIEAINFDDVEKLWIEKGGKKIYLIGGE